MMNDADETILEGSIKEHIVVMSFEPNSTHVLQKIIVSIEESKLDYVFYPLYERFIDLALDQNGLCVVKKVISKFKSPEKREMLHKVINENVLALV